MGHTTHTFSANKQVFFGQVWLPETPAKALLLIVHGHGEHSGRYAHVAAALNAVGIAVAGFDHYGHGKTAGKRGYVPSSEAVFDSMAAALSDAEGRVPGVPVFIMGHSMGGGFVANYVMKRPHSLRGVILSAPWLRLAFEPAKAEVLLAKIMNRIYPKFTQSSKLDATAISRDPAEVEKYRKDPLIHDRIGPPLFLGCHAGGELALAHAGEWTLPVLHMHGDADRLTSFEASEGFARRNGASDKTWIPWPGLFHEMHNEPEKVQVLNTLASWILARI